MGRTITINGERTAHEDTTTVRQLKQAAGIPQDDVVYYLGEDGDKYDLADTDTVDAIPDGATVGSDPVRGDQFG